MLKENEQPPVDEWSDRRLLTKYETRERLVSDIGRAKLRLEQVKLNDSDETEIMLPSRWLKAMESVREYGTYLDGPPGQNPLT